MSDMKEGQGQQELKAPKAFEELKVRVAILKEDLGKPGSSKSYIDVDRLTQKEKDVWDALEDLIKQSEKALLERNNNKIGGLAAKFMELSTPRKDLEKMAPGIDAFYGWINEIVTEPQMFSDYDLNNQDDYREAEVAIRRMKGLLSMK